ncbi:MAG: hypothetical protein IPM83_11845 [Ignavibacteria bacterium]|nr:hypothetical protein [Ignavibacteria bacterium]
MLALAATSSTIVAATTDGVVAASPNDLVFKRATPFVGDLAALLAFTRHGMACYAKGRSFAVD